MWYDEIFFQYSNKMAIVIILDRGWTDMIFVKKFTHDHSFFGKIFRHKQYVLRKSRQLRFRNKTA